MIMAIIVSKMINGKKIMEVQGNFDGFAQIPKCVFRKEKLIIYKNNGIMQKRFQRERGFVYETICYVCIALAIAIHTIESVPCKDLLSRTTDAVA